LNRILSKNIRKLERKEEGKIGSITIDGRLNNNYKSNGSEHNSTHNDLKLRQTKNSNYRRNRLRTLKLTDKERIHLTIENSHVDQTNNANDKRTANDKRKVIPTGRHTNIEEPIQKRGRNHEESHCRTTTCVSRERIIWQHYKVYSA
jgi:hypothetical protein